MTPLTNYEGSLMKREGGLFVCTYTLQMHLLFQRNRKVLTKLKFIATIYDVSNIRSPQPSTAPAYSGFSRSL